MAGAGLLNGTVIVYAYIQAHSYTLLSWWTHKTKAWASSYK